MLRAGDTVKDALVKKRAQEVRSLLFTFGAFNQTKAIAEQFLSLPDVSLVLSKPKQSRKQVAMVRIKGDALRARILAVAARRTRTYWLAFHATHQRPLPQA